MLQMFGKLNMASDLVNIIKENRNKKFEVIYSVKLDIRDECLVMPFPNWQDAKAAKIERLDLVQIDNQNNFEIRVYGIFRDVEGQIPDMEYLTVFLTDELDYAAYKFNNIALDYEDNTRYKDLESIESKLDAFIELYETIKADEIKRLKACNNTLESFTIIDKELKAIKQGLHKLKKVNR